MVSLFSKADAYASNHASVKVRVFELNIIWRILITHIAFYRQRPWLMALFVLGFSLGSALLTAITGLNQEAKTRYSHSSALIENPVTHIIQPLIGKDYLAGELWLKRGLVMRSQFYGVD